MISNYVTAVMLLGMASVAGGVAYSFSVDSKAAQSQTDTAHKMPAIAEHIASLARIPAGQNAYFPPAGIVRDGIYTVPPGLGDADTANDASTYLYCPLVPVTLTGVALPMPQPSGDVVAGQTRSGLVVAGQVAPAINPRPIAAIVAALPTQRLPDCSQITFGATAASGPGAIVRLVVVNEAMREDQLKAGIGATLHVAPTAAGAADGTSADAPMTLENALAFWFARKPRQLTIRMSGGVFAGGGLAAALSSGVGAIDLDGASKLVLLGSGSTVNVGSSNATFDAVGDLALNGVTFIGNVNIRVREGRTATIRSATVPSVAVRSGGRLVAGAGTTFTGASTAPAALVIEGVADLSGALIRSNEPCAVVTATGLLTGRFDCSTPATQALYVYGRTVLEGNAAHTAVSSVTPVNVYFGGVLETGSGSSLSVQSTSAGGAGIRLQNAVAVIRGNVSSSGGMTRLWDLTDSRVTFGAFPAVSQSAAATAVPAFRLDPSSRLDGADASISAVSGTTCIAFTDTATNGLWSAPAGSPFAVTADEPLADPTPGTAMTQADVNSNESTVVARNLLRARLRQQVAIPMGCS